MFSKSTKTGNVLSEIESQGLRKQKGFGPQIELKRMRKPSGVIAPYA
jgi:hypothetical protein